MTIDQLWNKVEASETRKNSTVARELVVALPHELNRATPRTGRASCRSTGRAIPSCRTGCGASARFGRRPTQPPRTSYSVPGRWTPTATLAEKNSRIGATSKTGPQEVLWMRGIVEAETNFGLERAGSAERIDMHLADQRAAALDVGDVDRAAELDRPATLHEGPRVTQIRREAARAGRAPLGLCIEPRPMTVTGNLVATVPRCGRCRRRLSTSKQRGRAVCKRLNRVWMPSWRDSGASGNAGEGGGRAGAVAG